MIHASFDFRLDRAAMRSRFRRADKRYHTRAGAYIRRVAINSVPVRKKRLTRSERTARVGAPPVSNSRFFKRSILFAFSTVTATTVIGPTGGRNSPSPAAFEHGGRFPFTSHSRRSPSTTLMGNYRRFPTMRPALIKSAPKLSEFWADSFGN